MRTGPSARKGTSVDFANPPGAPAFLGPQSLQWRIYKNPVALTVGGVCAVLLEFADPRIRSGVWDHSTYKIDPIGRSERTGLAAMVGVYGPKETAEKMIAGITRMHSRVEGHTPDGQPYRAMDPELLNWVYATAAYGFLKAYNRFVTPLSDQEQARFWNSGEDIAALYGVTQTPTSEDDFLAMMEGLAPGFEPHPINREFLQIIESSDSAPGVPRFIRRAIARGAVSLLPPIVREKLALGPDYNLTLLDRMTLRCMGFVAERKYDPASAPARASERLGLPGNFLWRSAAEQQRLLGTARPATAETQTG
ncbi:oxygenase MpaB family protein [Parahaliea mediterranea]|uniref:oxygenase MpaB family protein n=1 Tax=Parahaliea mediterranea TaxID=651086 RepID=UPI000E2F6979|nr:oxygenase MpaB family protein [Parahaliea mediterranea]